MTSQRGAGQDTEKANRTVAQNRRARHDYQIDEIFEAGLILSGSEVKSLRRGQASLVEAYANDQKGELFLLNAYIAPYDPAKTFGHTPRRPRKLLLHRREVIRLISAVRREGMTLVPLSIYFTARGIAKLALALARGKRKADQRESIKEREWQRQKARLLRDRG